MADSPTQFSPATFSLPDPIWQLRDGLLIVDAEQAAIALANPAAARLLGYNEPELTGLPLARLAPEQGDAGKPQVFAWLDEWQAERERFARAQLEWNIVRKDGREIIAEVTLSPIGAGALARRYVLAITRDRTPHRQKVLELSERQALFHAMADSAPVMIWMAGPDGQTTFFNRRWLEFTGRSPGQELGEGWAEGVHPDDLDRCLAVYFDALASRSGYDMTYRLRRADGEYRWIHDRCEAIVDRDGTFYGLVGYCADVTEREAHAVALFRSNQRFEAIFRHTDLGAAVLDLDGRLIQWNDSLKRLFGYPDTELRQLRYVDVFEPEDLAAAEAEIARLRAGESTTYQQISRFRRRDGTTFYGEATVNLARDQAGRPDFAVALVEDVTSQVRARQRRDALLRIVHLIAAQQDRPQVLDRVLAEAVALVGAEGGLVFEWSEDGTTLVPTHTTAPEGLTVRDIALDQGIIGRALREQRAVLANDYAQDTDAIDVGLLLGLTAVIAAPLRHEGRVLGVIAVGSSHRGHQFTPEDAEDIEVLAAFAATEIIGLEHARLAGAKLCSETEQQEITRLLDVASTELDELARDATLPPHLRSRSQQSLDAIRAAAGRIEALRALGAPSERDPAADTSAWLDD